MRYFFKDQPPEENHPPCAHPGCMEPGPYKAPKSRENLRDYQYFCLDHVREYNAKWNFFAGYDDDAMYEQMRENVVGERPTWPASKGAFEQKIRQAANFWGADFKTHTETPKPPPSADVRNPIREAFATMGLTFDAEFNAVKQQFRKLVKKYHPDTQPGEDPKNIERFHTINAAYVTLKGYFSGDRDRNLT